MLKKDIRFLSELGYSLWSDPESAQSLVRDTVSTIAFAEKDSLIASEKAVRALLKQAEKRGMIVQPRLAQGLLQPGALASQDPLGAFQENGLTKELLVSSANPSIRFSLSPGARAFT
jgi:hypothetical protein